MSSMPSLDSSSSGIMDLFSVAPAKKTSFFELDVREDAKSLWGEERRVRLFNFDYNNGGKSAFVATTESAPTADKSATDGADAVSRAEEPQEEEELTVAEQLYGKGATADSVLE